MIRKWGKGAFDLSRLKNISDDSYMKHSGCLVAFKVVTYHGQCAKSQLVWFGILRQYRKFRYLPVLDKSSISKKSSQIICYKWISFIVQKSKMKFNTRYQNKSVFKNERKQDWGH